MMISNLSQVLDEEREARRAAEEENEILQEKAEGEDLPDGRIGGRREKGRKE